MRKIIIIIILCIFLPCLSIYATPDTPEIFYKGNFKVGGYFNIYYDDDDRMDRFTLWITSNFGYFLFNRFEINIMPRYNYHHHDYHGSGLDDNHGHIFEFDSGLRYYFLYKSIYPYIGAGVGLGYHYTINIWHGDRKTDYFEDLYLSPNCKVGFIFEITNKFYLDLFFNFTIKINENIQPDEKNDLSHGVQFHIGITKYFIINKSGLSD